MDYFIVKIEAVIAIPNYNARGQKLCCARDWVTVEDGTILGWEEEEMHLAPAEELRIAGFPVEEVAS